MKSTYQNSISGTGFYEFSTNKNPEKNIRNAKRMKKEVITWDYVKLIVDFLIQWKEILKHILFPDLDRFLLL